MSPELSKREKVDLHLCVLITYPGPGLTLRASRKQISPKLESRDADRWCFFGVLDCCDLGWSFSAKGLIQFGSDGFCIWLQKT